jgi:protein-S-isoprenylcysteine O-methyltransferase Ste14
MSQRTQQQIGVVSSGRRRPRELQPTSSVRKLFGLAYAATAFLGTFAFFATFIIFLGNLPRPEQPWLTSSADVGTAASDPFLALASNALLLMLFSLQHSLMARTGVKQIITSIVPSSLERATYVHAANITGFLFILLWQPVPIEIWNVENALAKAMLWIAFGAGWLLLFAAAISIDIFELLGVKQAWAWIKGHPPRSLALKTNWLYRYVEHPMYIGVILGFWMTPFMTVGHAALAAQLTLYIAFAVRLERRDLQTRFGEHYAAWRDGHELSAIPIAVRGIAKELPRTYLPNRTPSAKMHALLSQLRF